MDKSSVMIKDVKNSLASTREKIDSALVELLTQTLTHEQLTQMLVDHVFQWTAVAGRITTGSMSVAEEGAVTDREEGDTTPVAESDEGN